MKKFEKYIVGKNVLDVGCVAQVKSSLYVKHQQMLDLKPKNLVGVDTNLEGVNAGRELGYNLIWGDIQGSYETGFFLKEFPDRFFDSVFLLDVIEHLADAGSALDNINKIVLETGGYVIVTTPNAMAIKWHQQWLEKRKTNINPDHVHWYCIQTLTSLFKRYNFELEEMLSTFDEPGLVCIFRKK